MILKKEFEISEDKKMIMDAIIAEYLSDPDLKLEDLKDLTIVTHRQSSATLIDLINVISTITNVGAPALYDIEDFQTSARISMLIHIVVNIGAIPTITTHRVFIRKLMKYLMGLFISNNNISSKIGHAKNLISSACEVLNGIK